MLSTIKKFFEQHIQEPGASASESLELRLRIATVALLLETARADFDVHDDELSTIAKHAQLFFDLDHNETDELVRLAEQEARNATSYYGFTSLINNEFTPQQSMRGKMSLLGYLYSLGKM